MNTIKLTLCGVLGVAGVLPQTPAPPDGDGKGTLVLFIGQDSPGQGELSRRAVDYVRSRNGSVRLRTVLLVRDFAALGRVKEESPFMHSLQELSRVSRGPLDLAIYDVEGLALAKAWKVDRLPALVFVAGKKAHVQTGSRASPTELAECR